ncbi:MAG: aspartate kinase [Oscillospiraceae bacterium]|nr:aspartate kinase [Oscillospiraceae bacterium]
MNKIVVKFGGSSLASAQQIRKAVDIIRANPDRRYVVASAPGKRSGDDIKVTDLLYSCCELAQNKEDFLPVLQKIHDRFSDIVKELGVDFDVENEIAVIRAHLEAKADSDYMASRGEYLNSKIIAAYLGFPFVDAADYVTFYADGTFNAQETNRKLSAALADKDYAVVPGFYGALPDGAIRTFSRGGSDLTGSIVALAVGASLYENWTDVSGMLAADPRIVDAPHTIEYITYKELRELSYMGATVLHEDAVFPVRTAGIPINIRNTNAPEDAGTMIVPTMPDDIKKHVVTGVAGKKGFSSIQIEKSMMNAQSGFLSKVMDIIAANGVPFEHCPTGIDTISVIVSTEAFRARRDSILREIHERLHPDMVVLENGLAMIAVVGQGMVSYKGVAARIFGAIAEADINIRMIDQGSSELNIIIGVEEADYEKAIRSIYKAVENLM